MKDRLNFSVYFKADTGGGGGGGEQKESFMDKVARHRKEHPERLEVVKHVGPDEEPEGPSWWQFGRRRKSQHQSNEGGSFVSHMSEVLDEKIDNAK